MAPCNWPRARYLVRGLKPLAFVRLMLRRLGFNRDEVQQIIAEAVRVYALDWSAALARRMAARSTPPVEVLRD